MSGLDVKELTDDMLRAAQDAAGDAWESVSVEVSKEIAALSACLGLIQQGLVAGTMDAEGAGLYFKMTKNTAETWKYALKGHALIVAQKSVNGILGVIRQWLIAKIGWVIF